MTETYENVAFMNDTANKPKPQTSTPSKSLGVGVKAPVKRFRLEPLDSAKLVSKKQRSRDTLLFNQVQAYIAVNDCFTELRRMAEEGNACYMHFKECKKKVEQIVLHDIPALYNEMKATLLGHCQISRRLSRRGKGEQKKPPPRGLYWRGRKLVSKAKKTLAKSKINQKRKQALYSRRAGPTTSSTSTDTQREGHSEPAEGEHQLQHVDSPSNEEEHQLQHVDSPSSEEEDQLQHIDSPSSEDEHQLQHVDSPSSEDEHQLQHVDSPSSDGEYQPQQVDSPGIEDDGSPRVFPEHVRS
nr:PREDICTED: uncharacterized protein LOC100566064 isoform X2 [Anolis carolinensis]|eukprot:XP_016853799.1 PREDICTED: uncharacterized protein LOC100566064 isoform X2 [Anolis carolinensis]